MLTNCPHGNRHLQTRIQTAVTSGDAPDVVKIGNTWAVSLQATGAFLELDDEAITAVGLSIWWSDTEKESIAFGSRRAETMGLRTYSLEARS